MYKDTERNMNATSAVPWLISEISVDTVTRMEVGLISVAGFLWALRSTRFFRVRLAAAELSQAKLERIFPEYLLPRDGLMQELRTALELKNFYTVLVYGERGAGKTTAIQNALSQRRGVALWNLRAEEGQAATAELIESWKLMFSSWEKPDDRSFDKLVCKRILKKQGNELIVVVSVQSSAQPSALKSVLYFCKTMSYDTKLVRFVVDISSSLAAVALRSDLSKLRVRGVEVGDVTLPEASDFLDHMLPQNWARSQIQKVSSEISVKFDLILLSIVVVCEEMDEGMGLPDALRKVNQIYDAKMKAARDQFFSFDAVLKEKFKGMTVPNLLDESKLDKLDVEGMHQLRVVLPPPDLMEVVSQVGSPYIFSLDPFTRIISLNGKVVTEAFIQHYKKKKK